MSPSIHPIPGWGGDEPMPIPMNAATHHGTHLPCSPIRTYVLQACLSRSSIFASRHRHHPSLPCAFALVVIFSLFSSSRSLLTFSASSGAFCGASDRCIRCPIPFARSFFLEREREWGLELNPSGLSFGSCSRLRAFGAASVEVLEGGFGSFFVFLEL